MPDQLEWHEDPDVISWDWREQPDLDELTRLLARHGVTVTEVDTGTDQYAIRIISDAFAVALEDALCRRVWAAAVRWEADQFIEGGGEKSGYYAACLEIDAKRIESGGLTPWADSAEPATAPAEHAATPPADPDPHPDTPQHTSGILGRALLDANGDAWPARSPYGWGTGPVREVLLVDPAAYARWRRVVEEAESFVAYCRDYGDPVGSDLVAAVDALTGGPERAAPFELPDVATPRRVVAEAMAAEAREPDPEPAGDGPGWTRCGIRSVIDAMELAARDPEGGAPQVTVEDVAELRGLLADRDRRAQVAVNLFGLAGRRFTALEKASAERDAARAELAEVTADRDRLHRLHDENETLRADLSWHCAAREAMATALLPVHNEDWECTCTCEDPEHHDDDCRMGHRPDCPADCTSPCPGLVDRLRADQLATARRDTAAATLQMVHDIALGGDGTISARSLAQCEAEIRTGQRDTPGTEPAQAGGEESGTSE